MQCPQCGSPNIDETSGCAVCGLGPATSEKTAAPAVSPNDRNLIPFPPKKVQEEFSLSRRDSAVPKVDLPLFPVAAPAGEVPTDEEKTRLLWREELETKLRQYRARRGGNKKEPLQENEESNFLVRTPPAAASKPPQVEAPSPPDEPLRRQSKTELHEGVEKPDPALAPPIQDIELDMDPPPTLPKNFELPASVQRIKQQRQSPRRSDLFQQSLLFEAAAQNRELGAGADRLVLPVAAASPRTRFAAALLDLLIVGGIELFFVLIVFSLARATQLSLHLAPRSLIVGLSGGLILMLGYLFFFIALTQKTLGMRRLDLTLINFAGEPVNLKESALRTAGYVVSAGSLMLGFLWVLFDIDALTWHDRISRTYPIHSHHLTSDS